MQILLIGLAAVGGGIAVDLLGWAESKEGWDWRKFAGSIIRSVVAACPIVLAFNFTEIGPLSYVIAFFTGAGGDAALKRAMAAWPGKE
jgi:hypothetical protein